MTHSQESRVSSTQDNFRLSEESRSSVSALVSRLNSSALGVDHSTDNEKLRGNSSKMKDQKLQDPFPWMNGFCNLCQAAVGSRNVRHLENLMIVYLENVTPNVKDCYTKPNRAAKLKKSMNDTLIFFHLFYQEIKETLEHSFYLEKMTSLVSMFMDMEIKASLRGRESLKKVASRLTSSLYIFLDNSEEHMLDAILMTKFVHKNYREICHPLLLKLLNNICTYPMYEMLYVRCLLTFKLWKKIVPDAEERKCINKTAMQKLHTPPHLMENIKAMGNVLPRIPKTKKNITLFLMQSNFNLKNACQEFLKSVKKPQKSAFNQGLGVEIDKPLFFVNHSGDSSPTLTEKEDDFQSDSGCSNNLINDIWSSISTVESNAPQEKRLNDLTPEQPRVVDPEETPKKNKKAAKKKKGKKQKALKSVGSKKKKKSLALSEKSGKQAKKLSKLKGKKKKKKKLLNSGDHSPSKPKHATAPQIEDKNPLKVTTSSTQIEESTPVIVQPNSPMVEEHNEIRVIKVSHLRADPSMDEESQEAQPKHASSSNEESVASKDNKSSSKVGESDQVAIQTQSKKCEKSVDQQPRLEEHNLTSAKKSVVMTEDSNEIALNQVSSVAKECGIRKAKPTLPDVEGDVLKANAASVIKEELKTSKNSQSINKPDDVNQSNLVHCDDCSQEPIQTSPHIDEYSQNKDEQATDQLEDIELLNIKQAFLHIVGDDQLKFKQAMLQIGDYDEIKVQRVMGQFEASEEMRIRQAMYQFMLCEGKMIEAKIEPQIPKTEKCDSPPSDQNQESEILSRDVEPPVKKVKLEIIANVSMDSSYEPESSVASEAISNITDISCLPSEKTADYSKPHAPPKESVLSTKELNTKCAQSDKAECAFDNSRPDLFTVDSSSKDPISEKVIENPVNSVPVITNEEKPNDLSQKSKTSENSAPLSVYAVVAVADTACKQEVCDNETADNESVDANKSVQADSYSDVEIVDELKPLEAGKCEVSASEEEIVLGDDGDLLPQQAALGIFAGGNEDVVREMLECSERQYPMSRGVLVENMEFDNDNHPVSDELEPEPSSNISGYENNIVDNFYSKAIKDDNPNLYDSHSLYRIDEWIQYDRNSDLKAYELERPVLPAVWMEEEDDEITETDMPKSFDSTPKRGMGKMSFHDAVMSYSRQKELHASTPGRHSSQSCLVINSSESESASTSGRHNSQGCLMMNSSESGSGSTEASPILSSSASGSSSPRSESAIDTVESVAHENMDTCDNIMKTSEHGVPHERVPDVSTLRYYNSNYPKSPDLASSRKDVGYNAQIGFTSKIGSHRMDNARVVVETMEQSLLSQAINDRLTATSSRPETSSRRNNSEASSQHSPLKRKKSSKSLPEQTVDSHSSPGKHETGEAGNYAAQSRATIKGRRRRGRPPSKGKGVSSSCKLSSDTKSTRKHGYSGKGRNDPEFQISSSKKSQQHDPPLTRSLSKKFGISATENLFDRL